MKAKKEIDTIMTRLDYLHRNAMQMWIDVIWCDVMKYVMEWCGVESNGMEMEWDGMESDAMLETVFRLREACFVRYKRN